MAQRRVPTRRLAPAPVLAAAVISAATLSGCGTGVEAGTLDPAPSNGVRLDVGDLRIANAMAVVGEDSSEAGVITMTIVNRGTTEDSLEAIEVNSGEGGTVTLQPRRITLPPGMATVVPTGTRPYIEIETDAPAGGSIPITMQFENAGTVSVRLPILAPTGAYATLTPAATS